MGLIDRIEKGLSVLRQEAPTEPPDRFPIVGPGQIHRYLGLHVEELDARRLRQAYRSLVAAFITFRSQKFAPYMDDVTVVRQEAQGEFVDVEQDHPWVRLLNRPNPYTSTTMFWEPIFQIIDARGHADLAVEYGMDMGREVPQALHIIWPDYGTARPVIGPMGETVAWYYQRTGGGSETLPAESIIRLKEPHPSAPHRTMGKIEAAAYEIDTRMAQNVFQRDKARGQGRPNMILHAENISNFSEARSTARKLSNLYNERNNLVPVSYGSWAFEEMNVTPQEMEFLEGKKLTIDELLTIFQIPKGMLASEDSATGRGRSGAKKQWEEDTVEPKITKTVEQMAHEFRRIFRAEDSGLTLEAPSVVTVPPKDLLEMHRMRLQTGTPINRLLLERGEEEVEGGDEAFIPGNMVPLRMATQGF